MGALWRQLLTPETITRGWHLARADVRQDFAEDHLSTDTYGHFLKQNVDETLNRVTTGTYQARPLFRIEVPKGVLSFRPGSVIPIQDRVVISAIVLLMAPRIDQQLSDSVYSWRLKDPIPKKGPIFRETDITDLPFLKKATVRSEVDPFEGWYRLWPEFDREARAVFQKKGFRYLATSDIAAYFENIQLPILRDQLLTFFNDEPELINLLCHFLESWSDKTADGRPHHRGIPQGNFVSSFLGNLFLMPLDRVLSTIESSDEIAYFRYMDDVRIFTKSRGDARVAVLLMARKLRELHLNVQTAKTRIYDENQGEIHRLLIDERADRLTEIIEEIRTVYKGSTPPINEKVRLAKQLNKIARDAGASGQRILGSKKSLEGLTLRVFSRWITAHMMIDSDYYIGRLLREISKSSDSKLTRKLVASTKRFPRKRAVETTVMSMIQAGDIIFPYQEGECLRAIRYLSNVSDTIIDHAWSRLRDSRKDRYLRMQSAYLLSRTVVSRRRLTALDALFDRETDPYVQVAISLVLAQAGENNGEVVRKILLHPNEKIREVGKLFRAVKNEPTVARSILGHALRTEIPWLTCDYLPMLHLMSNSMNREIRSCLHNAIREPRRSHPIYGVRQILASIFTNTRQSL